MSSALSIRDYLLDPNDPRAPSAEQWERMSPDERRRVVDTLPADVPEELFAPEGDAHRKTKTGALDALDRQFRRIGRKVYLSSELAVYYPDEPRFAPDVLAVLDAEPHERMKWVVAAEGKGLDFVLEVHVAGDARKDLEANVAKYARLGIAEYFIFDRGRLRLTAYRLPSRSTRTYRPILPQRGRYASGVLGVDLAVEGDGLRFYYGEAALPEADEIIAKLGAMTDKLIASKEDAERALHELAHELEQERSLREDEQKRREDEQKRREDEQKRREEAEHLLAEARAEIERLRRRS